MIFCIFRRRSHFTYGVPIVPKQHNYLGEIEKANRRGRKAAQRRARGRLLFRRRPNYRSECDRCIIQREADEEREDCNYGLIIPFTPITRSPIYHRTSLSSPLTPLRPTTTNPFLLPTFLPTADSGDELRTTINSLIYCPEDGDTRRELFQ